MGFGSYNTRTSCDGYEALDEVFGDTVLDLIVCDLRLPGINGIEAINRIKQYLKDRNRPDVPVIFITGYTESELYQEAKQLGRVFAKPFDTEDFLSGIQYRRVYRGIGKNNEHLRHILFLS
jgi:CheY-like chemotaxis protein